MKQNNFTKTRMKKHAKKLIKRDWIYRNTDLKQIKYQVKKEPKTVNNEID